MLLPIRNAIKKSLRASGYDLVRYKHPVKWLQELNIDLVFDVGANTGIYAKEMLEHGFKGTIVSFEPVQSSYALLVEQSKAWENWLVHERCAIGDKEEMLKINIASDSQGSSLLNVSESQFSSSTGIQYTGAEDVMSYTLDSIYSRYLNKNSKAFLKIDVQGFEDRVLSGAPEVLQRMSGLQMELSMIPVYEGQETIEKLLVRLKALGFTLAYTYPICIDTNTHRLLQIDGIFLRD